MISIVIPTYKEKDRLPETIDKIEKYCAFKKYNFEIIIIVEKSDFETKSVALNLSSRHWNISVIDNSNNKGKGGSVKSGVFTSKGDYIFFSDADLSTPIEEIEKLIIELNKGCDIVVGSRYLPESKILKPQPLFRRISGFVFRILRRIILVRKIKDTQCGFKGFKKDVALNLFSKLSITGFAFDVEILHIAEKIGYIVKEVPVIWQNNLNSKVLPIKTSFEMLIDILKIKLKYMYKYGRVKI